MKFVALPLITKIHNCFRTNHARRVNTQTSCLMNSVNFHIKRVYLSVDLFNVAQMFGVSNNSRTTCKNSNNRGVLRAWSITSKTTLKLLQNTTSINHRL